MAKTPRARVAAPAPVPAPPAPAAADIAASTPAQAEEDRAPEQTKVEAAEILDPADFGLVVDDDGMVSLEMLTGLSGPKVCLAKGDPHRCEPQEACRLVRAEFARAAQPAA